MCTVGTTHDGRLLQLLIAWGRNDRLNAVVELEARLVAGMEYGSIFFEEGRAQRLSCGAAKRTWFVSFSRRKH